MSRLAPSTRADLRLTERVSDSVRLLQAYRRRMTQTKYGTFHRVFTDLEHFDSILARYDRPPLSESRVFEVGFGGRPWRLMTALAMGADAYGVDAEVPSIGGGLAGYREILRTNGAERMIKTLARAALFDRREDAEYRTELETRGLSLPGIDPSRLIIGDAADCNPPGKFDLVYSVEVFEHVSRESMTRMIPRMAQWLGPDGLVFIRPDIFTGIHGGHLFEWRAETFDKPIERRSEPWEHLRKKRFKANTSLNKMTRAEYVDAFSTAFEIVEVIESPRNGSERFLTPDVRADLMDYTDTDLLDPAPLFVLRRLP